MVEFANRLVARGHSVTFYLPEGVEPLCVWMRCDAAVKPMPAGFDDELDVAIEVTHLGTTSMVTDLHIRRDGELLVEGRLAHVFVDTETHTKTPIPEGLRTALGAE